MLAAERRERLLGLLDGSGHHRVVELADALGVSLSTVRRDLQRLHDHGQVARVRGGAASHAPPRTPPDGQLPAKRSIGRRAAAEVEPGSTVMLLGGSTTLAMVPFLVDVPDLTVVTNGLDIAHALAHTAPRVTLLVTGGLVHRAQHTMVGALAEDGLRGLHVDTLFAGAWGLTAEAGATGTKVGQAHRPRSRAGWWRHVDRLVLLCDASKIGRRGPVVLAGTEHISAVVTDGAAPGDELDRLRAHGISVSVVDGPHLS
ncbi:DeoR/GlpR family DNA-binding transcription regulator [uncultured Jatrophihabitans sp.]|uniref:DeoR/GlpR family DNA-binding transcription regulator n=1 Tax=uncultured Jatrophihabitans sp. TaxID=1610747 RepID=UPI0035CCA87B